jgi:3-dehydroquinate synthase
MKHATIHIQDKNVSPGYDVIVGEGLLSRLPGLLPLERYSSICLINDKYTQPFLAKLIDGISLRHTVITVPVGDKFKSIETVQTIWKEMMENRCDRKTLVINIGGGVVGDMGGFAASTYMRGIDFVQIPTSLLAQVDASVGGKLGVNFNGIKNSIGSFQQPLAVIIDIETLDSLPERQLNAGFGEIIKHGLIADIEYFIKATAKKPKEFSRAEMIDLITGSVKIKRDIIEADLTENHQRKLVNFGHTIGHAIESISQSTDNPLLHGEAVSIGMVAEARLSQAIGMLSEQDVQTIKRVLESAELPTTFHVDDKELLMNKMLSDKKNTGGKIMWTLLKQIGEGIYNQELPEQIVEEEVQKFLVI